MKRTEILARLLFRLRKMSLRAASGIRVLKWNILGARVSSSCSMGKGVQMTWPHRVNISGGVKLESNVFFKHDGMYGDGHSIVVGNRTFIGCGVEFNVQHSLVIEEDCLIASGAIVVDHDHGLSPSDTIGHQACTGSPIRISKGSWVGANCVLLKGSEMGPGSVLAAGAVLTGKIPALEIWGGVPAKKIGTRLGR